MAGWAWLTIQVLLGLALLVVAGFVVAGELEAQRALVALALVAVVAALAALRPNDLRELVARLSEAGPLKFATGEAEEAAAQNVGAEADEQGFQDSLVDLRLKLEYKLAYIAKHLLGKVGNERVSSDANFVTVGSLMLDGFLSREQARTAAHILTWTDQDLARAAPHEASALLAAANDIVGGVRATVFANMVKKDLEAAGWSVKAAEPKKKRRGWLASRNGKELRIVPVFATDEPSEVLSSVKERLSKQHNGSTENYVIAIPERSATQTSERPRVVRLPDLPHHLPT